MCGNEGVDLFVFVHVCFAGGGEKREAVTSSPFSDGFLARVGCHIVLPFANENVLREGGREEEREGDRKSRAGMPVDSE